MNSILIVEDDLPLREYLLELMSEYHYMAYGVGDVMAASEYLKKVQPDLILLDLGLPKTSGESLCIEVKKKYPQVKVIILTARNQSSDIVNGLNIGADDFVAKPFSAEVLIARIKARLRDDKLDQNVVKYDDLTLNKDDFSLKRDRKKIPLTPKEFQLIEYLIGNPGRVLTRDMILNRVWMYSPNTETRVVDIYISFLRNKIDIGFKKKHILSVRGFGYKFK
jgi:DNA-binding response OmpR family regulator